MERSVYVLRIKPGLRDMVPLALELDQLIIGWTDVPELLDPSLERDDFRGLLQQAYYSDSKTYGRSGSAAGNMWRFLRELAIGDIVLVPHRKNFYVAEVVGRPTHDPTVAEGGFRRAARWLNDKRPFARVEAPEVYAVLQERKTCYRVDLSERSEAADFLKNLVDDLASDLGEIAARTDVGPTMKDALVKARIGQGQFRDKFLAAWGNACAVTGCTEPRAIRASHAKRWADSTELERLDHNNGLPLIGTLDALFDAGLIAFSDDGAMIVSEQLSLENRKILGVPTRLNRRPTTAQADYLREHRQRYFRSV